MASIHTNSVREELERIKQDFSTQSAAGKVSSESAILIKSLMILLELLFSIFLEKTTKKSNRNSSKPSSQTGPDKTAKGQAGSKGKGKPEHDYITANAREVFTTIDLPVTQCDCCGESLVAVKSESIDRRTRIDVLFEKTVEHFEAEIKQCPSCQTINKGQFPKGIFGKLQYGNGLKAFIIHLLVSQMVSLNRTQKMIRAMIGQRLSEATLLSYILRLHLALAPWEAEAKTKLLALPAIHTDETSLRVQSKNHWVHIYAGGEITLKCLHRKRGKEAIEENDIIPRYGGVIIHDCWASYLSYKVTPMSRPVH